MSTCPNEITLQRLATGARARWRVRRHIQECSTCLGDLRKMREEEEILARIRRVVTPSPQLSGAGDAPHAATCSPRPQAPKAAEFPAIDGFRITRLIAEGGMGRVYEAEQHHPRRRAAIKVLRSGPDQAQRRLRLFRREADALGRLRHPDIAVVYSAGVADTGEPFLAMELVQGQTLDGYAARRALWVDDVLRLVARICRAVHHAHEHGVIHRDLKPSNIMVDAHGNPKVLDFGLARVAAGHDDTMASVTLDGRIAGTLAYMSPEQIGGKAGSVDARSDIYSLGVILYQLLTGILPVGVDNRGFAEIIDAIRTAPPVPPSRLRPELSPEVECIVLRALRKRPEERYQSAGDLADDIDRRLAGLPVSRWRVSRTAIRRRAGIAAAAVLFLLAGSGVWAWRANTGSGDTTPLCEIEGFDAPCDEGETTDVGTRDEASVHRLGPMIVLFGDLADIERSLRERLELMRAASQDCRGTIIRLALVLERQGGARYAEAEQLFREVLKHERNGSHRRVVALVRIARCAGAQGHHEQAEKFFAECSRLVQRLGPQQASVRTEIQVSMARNCMAQGRFDEARTLLHQAREGLDDGAANAQWSRWSVAVAHADYFAARHERLLEDEWRRRAAEVYRTPDAPEVCQQ